jgi:hypothetical protein
MACFIRYAETQPEAAASWLSKVHSQALHNLILNMTPQSIRARAISGWMPLASGL